METSTSWMEIFGDLANNLPEILDSVFGGRTSARQASNLGTFVQVLVPIFAAIALFKIIK
jgi:hypothetical protein